MLIGIFLQIAVCTNIHRNILADGFTYIHRNIVADGCTNIHRKFSQEWGFPLICVRGGGPHLPLSPPLPAHPHESQPAAWEG